MRSVGPAVYPVATMCRVLGVSRGGFYDWPKREASGRSKGNAVLLQVIREAHHESAGMYGAPRVHAELDERGPSASLNRVARVMREAGVQGVSPQKWTRTTLRAGKGRAGPDLVERDFTATGPNQRWVADITYVPTWAGFLYVSEITQPRDGKGVGDSNGAEGAHP